MTGGPPIGVFNQMWALTGVSDREAIATAIEDIRHAEAEEFASVWIGEHHIPPGGPGAFHGRVPASEVFLGFLAAATHRIAVGTGVKILASVSARRAAEEMATLNLLAPGRIEFGLGMGPTAAGFEGKQGRKGGALSRTADGDSRNISNSATGEDGAVLSLAPCPELPRENLGGGAR